MPGGLGGLGSATGAVNGNGLAVHDLIDSRQAMIMAITTVLPVPVAILSATRGSPSR